MRGEGDTLQCQGHGSTCSWLLQSFNLCLIRSVFKPFIFVDDVKLVPKAQSPCFGDDDPAKKEPRFQEKPDRRHELYKAHEWARAVIESDEVSPKEVAGGWGRSVRKETARWRAHAPLSSLA